MKGLLLTIIACALFYGLASAQEGGDKLQKLSPEVSSPELAEAQKLNTEVVKLFKAGKYDEATELARRVLQLREKMLAPDHNQITAALINLGEIYLARRKYGEAETYYQRLLSIHERAPTQDRPAIARILDRLAFLNYMQFDFEKSEKFYQRALTLREETHGADSLETATSLYNLAEFYRFRESYTKAEPLYQRAIEIKGKALGVAHADVEKALERYSCLYYAMAQPEKIKNVRSLFSFFKKDAANSEVEMVLNGRAVSLPKPEYPEEARLSRVSGVVVIKVWIDETGMVAKAEDLCGGHPYLLDAAVRAAYKARFTATLLSGAPVKVKGVISYNFVGR